MRITVTLILLNLLVFLITLTDPEYYIRTYGFSANKFISGEYWVIFTSMFLHAGLSHFFFNMVALFLIGSNLEKSIKGWKYLLAYFISGFIGNLGMMIPFLYNPDAIGVGASGAISGLIGFGTFACPGRLVFFQVIIPVPFIVAGALYFLTTTANLFVPSQVAYPVHLLGLISGFAMGLISVSKKERKRNILIFILVLLFISLLPYLLRLLFF
ncbi:MAG: rhomboid family intramembrane serine protease [Candidatus Aenigmatarchaeota archaeon]